VLECAVVGVPSELSEEDVKAFVVGVDGIGVDVRELRDWVAQRLAAFKVPRYWQVVESLPRTSTSRVAKHLLPTGHPEGEVDLQVPPLSTPAG
jgi:crotonobetaine/carnitine-CoA ligase